MANSEWEVVPEEGQKAQPQSEWEVVPEPPISMQHNATEPFAESLVRAPGRISEDIGRSMYKGIRSVPGFIQNLPRELGGMAYTATTHPGSLMNQAAAGITEQGHKLLNDPYEALQYGAQRLNLVPEDLANQFPHQKDISSELKQYFGDPKYAGEKLLRDALANSESLMGMKAIGSKLNPMNLTSKNVAKGIVKEGERQYLGHERLYNDLFDFAESKGINRVKYDPYLLTNKLNTIGQYQTPKQYGSIVTFAKKPTIRNAQVALKDVRAMKRTIDDTAKTRALTGEETRNYKALNDTEKHLLDSMFSHPKGNVPHMSGQTLNNWLRNKHAIISGSYKENVVPYKYNPAIQDFKGKQITSDELINRLRGGPFAVSKGHLHPGIARGAALRKLLGGLGVGGGLGYPTYQYISGNKE